MSWIMPIASPRAWMLAGCVAGGGWLAAPANAQPKAPVPNKAQRAALDALVRVVDGRSPGIAVDAVWQTHVMRASDGSHYVALRAVGLDVAPPPTPAVLYVRVSTHRDERTVSTERSAVREWLQGARSDPRPVRTGGSMAVARGEMPAGTIATRDAAADNIAALRLMAMERERERQRREAAEAARRAALENAARGRTSDMLPFEDFDLEARITPAAGDGIDIRRSIAAGPGDYDVEMAWTVPGRSEAAAVVHVIRHRLRLPAAPGAFGLSDLVVADSVAPVTTAYPPAQQNAHPYATGAIEVGPALHNTLKADGMLGLLVQVINPTGNLSGKPSVTVDFRIARVRPAGDEAVGTLPTQRFDDTRLPVDFDTAKGHPLFAAVRASLATFSRGRYRVTATAQDLLSGQTASTQATFDVIGTPASLLREAPRPDQPFRREAALTPAVRRALVHALTPAQPSAALRTALDAAADGQYAALLRDDLVPLAERPVALGLRALALFGLGDGARSVGVALQSATMQGVPAASLALLEGAVHALAGDDAAAIAAWERSTGEDATSAAEPLLVDAHLRRRDIPRATRIAETALASRPDDLFAARTIAAIRLIENRVPEALALTQGAPLATSPDLESRFLRLHALFATLVAGPAAANAATLSAEFEAVAAAYVADGGAHAALVTEWRRVMGPDARRGVGR